MGTQRPGRSCTIRVNEKIFVVEGSLGRAFDKMVVLTLVVFLLGRPGKKRRGRKVAIMEQKRKKKEKKRNGKGLYAQEGKERGGRAGQGCYAVFPMCDDWMPVMDPDL